MAAGRDRTAWNHTANLLALVANCHRARKSPPFKVRDFHPHHQRRELDDPELGWRMLAAGLKPRS